MPELDRLSHARLELPQNCMPELELPQNRHLVIICI